MLSLIIYATLIAPHQSEPAGCGELEALLRNPNFPTPTDIAMLDRGSGEHSDCLVALARQPAAQRTGQIPDWRVLTALEAVGDATTISMLLEIVRGNTPISATMGIAHVYSLCLTRTLDEATMAAIAQAVTPLSSSKFDGDRASVAEIIEACAWRDGADILRMLSEDSSPRVAAAAQNALETLREVQAAQAKKEFNGEVSLLHVMDGMEPAVEVRAEGRAPLVVSDIVLDQGGVSVGVSAEPDGVHVTISGVTIVSHGMLLHLPTVETDAGGR